MEDHILIKYYQVTKDFPSDSLKNYHFLDDKRKLQPSFSHENLDSIFDYIKWNWTNYEKTLLTKEDFELFLNSNLELSIDQLQPFISKKLLYMIQYKVDYFIGTFYTYYFKGSFLKKINNQKDKIKPINKDLFISIIVSNLLSAMKLSYYGFDVFNFDINEVITTAISKELLNNLRDTKYFNYPEILRDERNRIKNIQKHDCLNDYINELELLYNTSINSKNTSEYTSETQNEEVNNNLKKPLKKIPGKLLTDLINLIIDWFNTDNKKEISNLLKLKISKQLFFSKPFTYMSLVYSFLIVHEYYSETQVISFLEKNMIKHMNDDPNKSRINSANHIKYFNKWTEKENKITNRKYFFNDSAASVPIFLKIQNIFNKHSSS